MAICKFSGVKICESVFLQNFCGSAFFCEIPESDFLRIVRHKRWAYERD